MYVQMLHSIVEQDTHYKGDSLKDSLTAGSAYRAQGTVPLWFRIVHWFFWILNWPTRHFTKEMSMTCCVVNSLVQK
jgi:hypothetical protein